MANTSKPLNNVRFKILDRGFHVIAPSVEEGYIRSAAEKINELIKEYKEEGYIDFADIMAMIAVRSMVVRLQGEEMVEEAQANMKTELSRLRTIIGDNLISPN